MLLHLGLNEAAAETLLDWEQPCLLTLNLWGLCTFRIYTHTRMYTVYIYSTEYHAIKRFSHAAKELLGTSSTEAGLALKSILLSCYLWIDHKFFYDEFEP